MPITVQPAVCWRLVDTAGNDYPPDPGPTHYSSMEEAETTSPYADDPTLTGAPFNQPCVTIACDECGAEPDDDEFAHVHFPSVYDAEVGASVYEFAVWNGRAWCEDCVHEPHEPIVGPHGGVCDRCGDFDTEHEPVEVPR